MTRCSHRPGRTFRTRFAGGSWGSWLTLHTFHFAEAEGEPASDLLLAAGAGDGGAGEGRPGEQRQQE